MKRNNRLLLVAGAATAGLVLTACGTTGQPQQSSSSAPADCTATIAYMGPLTGDNANLGLNIVRGAKLALSDYNAKSPKCKVTLTDNDTQGAPDKATPIASQLVNDSKVIAVLGPTFSGETNATGATFNEAGLVTVSPSATNAALSSNGWKTFHRILGNDSLQGPAVARYIKNTIKPDKVFSIDDATDYGKPLTATVNQDLGSLVVGKDQVQQKQTDFGPTVTKVKASGADAVWYGGYYAEAGLLVKQLRAAGWKGTFVSGDGSKDPGFVSAAGKSAANGAVLTCPCAPASAEFEKRYQESSGEISGTYSTEGYDAMNILLKGMDAGKVTRPDMLSWVNGYEGEGVTGPIAFEPNGERKGGKVYAYIVADGVVPNQATLIE